MMDDTKELLWQLQAWMKDFGIRSIAALVLVLVGLRLARMVRAGAEKAMHRSKIDATLIPFFGNILYVVITILTGIMALAQLGVQTASFIAILGSAGLAIGLAVQGSLTNFAAGILIVLFRPFKLGDYIESGVISGYVEVIQILSTTLRTPDNRIIIVPNRKLFEESIINYSTKLERRIDLTIIVGYHNDIDRIKHLIHQVLTADPRILTSPIAQVGILKLAENGMHVAVRPWVKTDDYWQVYFDLQEALKKRFDQEGIDLPLTANSGA